MYEAQWPRGRQVIQMARFAKRLDTLQSKTVGILWDGVFRGDEIFPLLEKGLARRYPGMKFISYREFGSTHGGDESKVLAALPEKLKQYQCDAVLSGMGC
ncbi:MAG: hypothetical protein Q8O76_00310 [Chloroflexota bacterium]|nr:hypothetical protein [Chloroflexota bacterium]